MAVGTHKGFVQIWDAAAGKKLSMLEGHTARVGEEPPGPQGAGVISGGGGGQDSASLALCPASRGAGLEC